MECLKELEDLKSAWSVTEVRGAVEGLSDFE